MINKTLIIISEYNRNIDEIQDGNRIFREVSKLEIQLSDEELKKIEGRYFSSFHGFVDAHIVFKIDFYKDDNFLFFEYDSDVTPIKILQKITETLL